MSKIIDIESKFIGQEIKIFNLSWNIFPIFTIFIFTRTFFWIPSKLVFRYFSTNNIIAFQIFQSGLLHIVPIQFIFFSPRRIVSLHLTTRIQVQSFYDKKYFVISVLDVSKIFINISQLIGNKKKEKKHWERISRSDSRNVHIFFGGNVISFSIKDDTVPLAFDYYTIGQLLIRWANQMMARWWWEAFENEISLEARLFLWIFCF